MCHQECNYYCFAVCVYYWCVFGWSISQQCITGMVSCAMDHGVWWFTPVCSSASHCCLDCHRVHNVLHREDTFSYHGEQTVMKHVPLPSCFHLLNSFIHGPSLVELLVRLVSASAFCLRQYCHLLFIAGAMELILGGYEHDATLDTKAHTNSIDDSSSNGKRCRYIILIN